MSRETPAPSKEQLNDIYLNVQKRILDSSSVPKRIGSYEIVRKLAVGSFSTVYLAVHIFTRLEVVLKSTPKNQPNLVSEITNLRAFTHPHIIRLYELIVMPDAVWLALEYCPGEELFTHLVRNGAYREQRALKIFSQICGAVAYVHSKSIAHRDIKLENIMFDDEGNVKLGDFGFTRNYSAKSLLETICGTGPYMAPELFNKKRYNPEATDVWALGVILYALVYGQLPFDEDNEEFTKAKIISEEPEFRPGIIGVELELLIKSMLQKDPRSRPRVSQILRHALIYDDDGCHQLEILTKPEPRLFSTKAEKRTLKAMAVLQIDLPTVAKSLEQYSCDPIYGFWYTSLEKQAKLAKQEAQLSRKKSESRSLRGVARVARAIVRSPDTKSLRKTFNQENSPYVRNSTLSSGMRPMSPSSRSQLSPTPGGGQLSAPSSPMVNGGRLPPLPDEDSSIQAEPIGGILAARMSKVSLADTSSLKGSVATSRSSSTRRSFHRFLDVLKFRAKPKIAEPVFQQNILPARSASTGTDNIDENIPRTPDMDPTEPEEPVKIPILAPQGEENLPRTTPFPRPMSQISEFSQLSQLSQVSEMSKDSLTLNNLLDRYHRRTGSGTTAPEERSPEPVSHPKLKRQPSGHTKKEPRIFSRKHLEALPISEE